MKAGYGKLKAGSSAVSAALGAARSARNRATREAAADARDAGASARRYKRARAREDRERERAMNRRFRVQVADTERPRMKGRTPHRLFYRLGGQAMGTRITAASSGGTRSIHFAVTARGFASRTGRAWRGGEGERAALYIVREDALEGGEAGWWSNIAADRNELAAFHRASEAFERHDRANANVYMSEVIALPDSLTAKQRRKAVRRYCRTFDRRGLGYTVAMHLPDPNGDGRNYHCHIIYSLRPVTRLGAYDWSLAASKVADVNTPDGIRARRSLAVAAINATLKASGSTQRYTEASNRARGLGRPSPKQGQKQTWVLRRAAAAEAHLAALAPLQAATATLRAGLALLTRMEAARLDMVSRLRGVQKASADALADQDRHLVAVRIRVRDGLTRERSPEVEAEAQPDARVMAAKSNALDRLAGAMAGFDSPDTFETRIIAAAAAHARRQARRRADAEAVHAAARLVTAASSPDLKPWRTEVVARLSERRTAVNRPLPELTQTRKAVQVRLGVVASRIGASYTANRQRITDLAPGRGSEDTGRVDPPTATQGLAEPAARTPNTTVTPPALTGTAGDDLALFAANRDDEARRKRIAAAREAARIAEIRDRAFARLAAPGVRIRLADTGNYRIPSGILDADERAALNHADYRGETRARLASLHAIKNPVEARGDPPETATATSPGATVTAPTLAVAAVPIPSASQDEDLALLQAAKDLEDVKRGR